MSAAIMEHAAVRTPIRVQVARCAQPEWLPPFQYYTHAGEAIYALDFADHQAVARLLLHFEAEGLPLAQTLLADPVGAAPDAASWTAASRDELDELAPTTADFTALLAEMHLAASYDPEQLYAAGQLAKVRELSREAPIVIGGCGRSGTTLLLSILGAHPAVLAFPDELYAFYPYPFRLPLLIDALAPDQADAGWRRWCEKTPKNVRAFAAVHAAFDGDVRLIHIVRDGRDVVTSRHPNAEQHYYVDPERWVADVRAGLQHADKTLLVRYEDLVAEPETTLATICAYIGEPFDARLLEYEQHSSVRRNKAWEGGAAQPLHSARVEHWRAPEHAARVDQFLATPGASDLMAELGYL